MNTKGEPLYQVRPNGAIHSGVNECWKGLLAKKKRNKLKHDYLFRSLRKSTNQMLVELIEQRLDDDDTHGLVAASEISNMFLAQKNNLLTRLYRQTGIKLYARMNRYLSLVGDQMRQQGVFSA